jgi:hypothetical protein
MSKRSTLNSELILRSSFGNFIEEDFDTETAMSMKKQFGSPCTTVRLHIRHDTEALPGNLRRHGDQPHISLT